MQREEADGVDRRKWMGSAERKQTRGRRRGPDVANRGETVIDYAIVNEATWERVEEIQSGRKSRLRPSPARN
jgi:hypothetical protein